jgi:hypothetical protein
VFLNNRKNYSVRLVRKQPITKSELKSFTIAHKQNQITVKKMDTIWMLNNGNALREDVLEYFISIMNRMQVKSPVSDALREKVLIQNPSARTITLNIKNQRDIQFDLWSDTLNFSGTYYMDKGKSRPVSVHLPGLAGVAVDKLFPVHYLFWQDKTIFDYDPLNIVKVRFENHRDAAASFTLKKKEKGFQLKAGAETEYVEINNQQASQYLTYFDNIRYDSVSTFRAGELNRENLLYEISVTNELGKERVAKIFARYRNNILDPDVCYVVVGQGDNVYLARYYILDPILKEAKYFL